MCGVLDAGALLPARVFSEELPSSLVRPCSEAYVLTASPSKGYSKRLSAQQIPRSPQDPLVSDCYLLQSLTIISLIIVNIEGGA